MRNSPLLMLMLLLACGCATSPPSGNFSALYDGRSETAFVTEFPVGTADEAIARGDHAYTRGELDRALYLYVQAIQADDKRADAFFRAGMIHQQRGKLELAANALRHGLLRDPLNGAAHEALGLVLLDGRDLEQARTHLDKAHQLDRKRWKAVNALGVIADLQGRHTQAAAYFKEALVLEPESAKILTNLGYSLYLADDWAQAERALLQALEHAPDYDLALRNLALLKNRQGDPEQALQLLLKVTGAAQAHNDLGFLCLLDGNYTLAEKYFRHAVELSPSYYELAHRNLKRAQKLSLQAKHHAATAPRPRVALNPDLFASSTSAVTAPKSAQAQTPPASPVKETITHRATASGGVASLYIKRWVSANLLNVRDSDRADARLLDRLKRGRVVRVLREENGWAYVRYWEYNDDNIATREGWVHADFLTENRQRA